MVRRWCNVGAMVVQRWCDSGDHGGNYAGFRGRFWLLYLNIGLYSDADSAAFTSVAGALTCTVPQTAIE